ncbi:hypothetical protein [Paenibacillus sp. J2TS4]|uniref:hypothetical protein n=1 Tax=Paenibacillus sp. J2TS4 TaxID=2807194 RepID=UPI001B0C8802|nr:hypothetical protein [Paenibacillus sp. J2TS4]GIP31143.1 hypothetical protein J2TS4_03530 [Paenibacillus sp. J2TS4]
MSLVFVEYKIDELYREDYLKTIQDLPGVDQVELYEGSDQPGLFVEIWKGLGDEDYLQMKAIRTSTVACEQKSPHSLEKFPSNMSEGKLAFRPWQSINEYVAGGAGRVHIWKFVKV